MTMVHDSTTTLLEPASENDRSGRAYRFWKSPDNTESCNFGLNHELSDGDYVTNEASGRSPDRYYLISIPAGESTEPVTYIAKTRQYRGGPNTIVVVDFGEPETEFRGDQLEAVRFLRSNGREVLANKLSEMLRNAADDGRIVDIISLRDMVRLMVKHQRFADPFVSLDDYEVMYSQWRIEGNGLAVMSFPGGEEVILTVQADAVPGVGELDVSEQGDMHSIIRTYGHLIPCRN